MSASGTEGDADDVLLLVGIDGEGFGVRAGESAAIESVGFAGVVRIVETSLVLCEIDDDGHATIGHEALSGVRLRVVAVIPEKLDKARERRARSEKKAVHGQYPSAEKKRWE